MTARLQIFTFGTATLLLDGEPIDAFVSRKAEALLLYLACTQQPHAREVLAELLWHDRSRKRALANLRVVLSNLRKVVGPFVTIDRQTVAMDRESDYWLDVDALEASLTSGRKQLTTQYPPPQDAIDQIVEALDLYRDAFLAGFSLDGSRGFEEWAAMERHRLEVQVVEALQDLAVACAARGAYEAGITHARRLLRLVPLRETAHRTLMRLLVLAGRRSEALLQYEQCRRMLADELSVPPSEETETLYEQIRQGAMDSVEALLVHSLAPTTARLCPYRGLHAFSETDGPFFFGRDGVVERLHTEIRRRRLVTLLGPSGSGKSSVVFAGVLPELNDEPATDDTTSWLPITMRPGTDPCAAFATAIVEHLLAERTDTDRAREARRIVEALRRGDCTMADTLSRVHPPSADGTSVLLIVDQFEEVYTLCQDESIRRQYLQHLLDLVDPATDAGVTVLLTLRADFMGQALTYRPLADAFQDSIVHLGPMTRDELQRAIEMPAARQGVRFEAGLVERILEDAGTEPGRLPLLQFALTSLWEQQEAGMLTHAAYEAIGGVSKALTRHANRVCEGLSPADQDLARDVLLQLIHPGEGTEDTRRVATREELGDNRWALARRLADARLVVTNRSPDESETVEIVHEALIQNWGRLQGWMREDRAFRVWQERLRVALRQWAESDRSLNALLRGIALNDAERWYEERGDDLSARERDFIQASLDARDERRQEEAQRQARERELERRSRHRLRILAIVLAAAAIITTGLLVAAVGQWNAARASAAESQSLALATGAQLALRDERTDDALALAAAANAMESPPAQARFMLSRAAYAPGTIRQFTGHTAGVQAVVLSQTGETALSASDDHSLILWNVKSGDVIRRFTGHADAVKDVAWHEESDTILSGSADSSLILWDSETGEVRRRLTGHSSPVYSVALGPTGETALSGGADGTIIVWDLTTGTERRRLTEHTGDVDSVAISPDGRTALSGSGDRRVLLWNLADGEVLQQFDGHTDWVTTVAFTPDGTQALSGSEDTDVILWDLDSGEEVRRFAQETAGILSLDVSSDGRTLLAGSIDSIIVQWDLQTGEKVRQFLGHDGRIFDVAFADSGDRALSASEDGDLRLWELTNGAELRRLRYSTGAPSVAIDTEGERALTGLVSGDISLWDVATGRELRRLRGHGDRVFAGVAYSPDGTMAVSGSGDIFDVSDDNTVRVWDLTTGEEVQRMIGHTDQLWDIDVSPDGGSVLSASRDGTLRLWDVATGDERRRFDDPIVPTSVRFSPDGRTALVGVGRPLRGSGAETDYCIRWLDLETGEELYCFEGHGGSVMDVDIHVDGRRAISAGLDGVLILWDLEMKQEIRRLQAHSAGVMSVVLSPDGRTALSGSVDSSLILWDLESGTRLRHYRGHSDIVTDVAFAPDGRTALSAGARDGTVRRWRIDPSPAALMSWIDENRFVPDLTCEQRALYRVEPLC